MINEPYSYCPTCGRAHDQFLRPGLRRIPTDVYTRQRAYFATGDVADIGATFYEHRRPARQATVASDVVVPLLQSGVTAVLTSLVAIVPAYALNLSWLVVPTAGALAFVLMWARLLADHRRALWDVDRYQSEPERPQEAPPEAPPAHTTRLAFTLGNAHQEVAFPIPPDTLLKLAKVCHNGVRAFSERELAGAGKLLRGRVEYERVRDVLLDMGWLRWKAADKRQGLEWTGPGRAGLRVLASGRATAEELLN
jgi:hypothetical protein